MANTPIEAVYKALQDQFTIIHYPYVFQETGAPYYYLYEVNDPRVKTTLCETRGGESRITIGRIDDDLISCVDNLETMISFVESLRAQDYLPITIWDIIAGDVRDLTGLEQSQNRRYRREFDAIVRWAQ